MTEEHNIQKPMNLFNITWPILTQTFLNFLIGFVDMFMLSKYSDNAVGAVGMANQIIFIITLILGVIGSGAVILISQNLGAGNKKASEEIATISFYSNLLIGMIISLLLYVFRFSILRLMNCPAEFLGYGQSFLGIVGGSIFVKALFTVMSSILLSYGDSKNSMMISVGVNVLNIIGNYFVIFRPIHSMPALGVTGVACSTAISQTIGAIVLFMVLLKKTRINLSIQYLFHFRKKAFTDVLKIGIPTSAEQFLYNLSQLVVTFIISFIGTVALSTRVYTGSIMWMIEIPVYSLGIGTQIFIAHLTGGGKTEDVYKACFKSLKIGMAVTVGFAIVVNIFGSFLLGFFTREQAILSLGTQLLLIAIMIEPGKVLNTIIGSCLRATGDVRFPVYISIIFMWCISIPFSYLLGVYFKLGLPGVWLVFCMDESIRGLIVLWRWKSKKWQKMSFVANEVSSV